MHGVLLPILKEITINDVPLYSKQVQLWLRPGLNVVLGVNGLGKTTTVKIALIGILGDMAQNQAVKSIVSESHGVPTARVRFLVGNDEFTVERNLRSNRITKYRHVDSDGVVTEYSSLGPGDPDQTYQQALISVSGSGTVDNLHFLLSRLIFREEEAQHLIWDAADQHRVLRLLFMGGSYEAEWKEAFDQSVNDNTRFRQHKEFLRRDEVAQKRVSGDSDEISARLDETLTIPVGPNGRTLMQVREELRELASARQQIEHHLEVLKGQRDDLRAERHKHALERDQLGGELSLMETTVHERAFKEFSVLGMAARRLRQRSLCLFCDQTVSEHLRDHLLMGKLEDEVCPLCEQSLTISNSGELDAEQFGQFIRREAELTGLMTALDKRLSGLTREVTSYTEQLSTINQRLQGLQDEYIAASDGRPSPGVLEEQLAQLQGTLSHFQQRRREEQKHLDALDKARKQSHQKLEVLEQKLDDTTHSQTEMFSQIFGEFSADLLGRKADLQLVKRKASGQQKDYAVFQPVLDNKPRHRAIETATHERFLLDYAFRMSALTYYTRQTGKPAFFAIEPAEGTMDPVYADHLASTLYRFAQANDQQSLLIITNLRSVDFIRRVYGDLPLAERLERTVDFRAFGQLKGLQIEEHGKYDEIWATIFREEMAP